MLAASLIFFILGYFITFLMNFYSFIIVQLGMAGWVYAVSQL